MSNKVKLCLIVLISLLAASCGPNKPTYSLESEEFRPYLDSFFYEAGIRGKALPPISLTIRFGAVDPPALAYTAQGGDESTITMDPEVWRWAWDTQRELILYHEFGHAILHKGHTPYSTPAIMNPTIMLSSYYLTHRTQLIDDLFE